MKKIVFVSYNYYPPSYSGKLIISGKRFQDLDPTGFEVVVLTSGLRNSKKVEQDGNIQIHRSPFIGNGKISGRLNVIAFWLWSLQKIKLEDNSSILHFDECGYFSTPIFHSLGYRLSLKHFTRLAKIARRRKIPIVFEHAISDRDGNFAPDRYKREFLDQLDHIVCVSDALFASAKQMYPEKARKIVYGIEDDTFSPIAEEVKEQVRKEQGAGTSDIILCFVGLVVKRKGFDLISAVFPEVCQEFPASRLWVMGPKSNNESRHIHDEEVERYRKMLEPVKTHVKFFGNIGDRQQLAKLIAATDIFLFPTRQEGFGLAPVEAMACGVPPIISRIPGVTDLANIEGVTGLYINSENVEELKQAIRTLIADRSLRERMGKAARVRIEQDFSWKSHLAAWEHLYNGE